MSTEEDLARTLGAASKNPDWKFAAKHWDRVDDDKSKGELLDLARAARSQQVLAGESGTGLVQVGQWWARQSLVCQVLYMSPDGGSTVVLQWYDTTKEYAFRVLNTWKTPEVLKHCTRLPGKPF